MHKCWKDTRQKWVERHSLHYTAFWGFFALNLQESEDKWGGIWFRHDPGQTQTWIPVSQKLLFVTNNCSTIWGKKRILMKLGSLLIYMLVLACLSFLYLDTDICKKISQYSIFTLKWLKWLYYYSTKMYFQFDGNKLILIFCIHDITYTFWLTQVHLI